MSHKFKIVCGTHGRRTDTKIYLNDEILSGVQVLDFHADCQSHPTLTLQILAPNLEIEGEFVEQETVYKTKEEKDADL